MCLDEFSFTVKSYVWTPTHLYHPTHQKTLHSTRSLFLCDAYSCDHIFHLFDLNSFLDHLWQFLFPRSRTQNTCTMELRTWIRRHSLWNHDDFRFLKIGMGLNASNIWVASLKWRSIIRQRHTTSLWDTLLTFTDWCCSISSTSFRIISIDIAVEQIFKNVVSIGSSSSFVCSCGSLNKTEQVYPIAIDLKIAYSHVSWLNFCWLEVSQ